MKPLITFILVSVILVSSVQSAETPDLQQFFAAQTFQQTPANIEVLSESTEDGIKTTGLKFDGGSINGKPTRIFAYYSRPAADGTYPGALVIHGAGLNVLSPPTTYAKAGFAALAIDWAGEAKQRKTPRKPPFSEFESNGNMADRLSGQWKLCGANEDGIRIGVIFARRGLEFLRNQPEVDKTNLFSVGSSAGAHLSLILLGVEPGIKAAVVKYGTSFIRDIPGSYGGYFGPVSLCSKEDQDRWLAHFDPKNNIKNYNAKVLLISGTDDIFFWMRNVLMTYGAIPTKKRLLLRPNDNHQWVGDDPVSAKFFLDALQHNTLDWPDAPAPVAHADKDRLLFTITPSTATPLKEVTLVWKAMPRGFFHHGKDWHEVKAVRQNGVWVATIDKPAADSQLVAYALLNDEQGRLASTDTVELPTFPQWRGQTAPAQTLDDGNYLMNPSFDQTLSSPAAGWALLGNPKPEVITAEDGQGEGGHQIRLNKGMSCLRKALPGLPAGEYHLSFLAKSIQEESALLTIRTVASIGGNGQSHDQAVTITKERKRVGVTVTIPEGASDVALEIWGAQTDDAIADDFILLPQSPQ